MHHPLGAASFGQTLEALTNLASVQADFSGTGIRDDGVRSITNGLSGHPHLESAAVRRASVSDFACFQKPSEVFFSMTPESLGFGLPFRIALRCRQDFHCSFFSILLEGVIKAL